MTSPDLNHCSSTPDDRLDQAFAQYKTGLDALSDGDFDRAFNCFRQADYPPDHYELALLCASGKLPESAPVSDFLLWLNRSANNGFYLAQLALAETAMKPLASDDEIRANLLWLVETAIRGHADSQYFLAQLYTQGRVLDQSYAKAAYWFEGAAHTGRTDAMLIMGELFEQGLGVNQDLNKALSWYEKAKEAGNHQAGLRIPLMLGKPGVNCKNWLSLSDDALEKSLGYLTALANRHDNPDAQYLLGKLYAQGRIVKSNHDIAMNWYARARDNGHLNAQEKMTTLSGATKASNRWTYSRMAVVVMAVFASSVIAPVSAHFFNHIALYKKAMHFSMLSYVGIACVFEPYLTLEKIMLIIVEAGLIPFVFYSLKYVFPVFLKKIEALLARHVGVAEGE